MLGIKQYNFGARGGEVIGGGLARDLEGKFISKEELGSAIRQRLLDRLRKRKGIGEYGEATNREAVAGELGSRLPAGAMDGLAILGNGQPLEGPVADRLISAGLARVDNTGQVRLSGAGASLLIAANDGSVDRAEDALIRAQTQVNKGGGGGGGGGGSEELTQEDREKEKEEEEAANREKIANQLKGGANETSLEQINAMNEVRLGNDISLELAKQLAEKGMLEFDDVGIPYLSFDGRVFINASNEGQLSLVRDVLARAKAKYARKVERIDRLEKNTEENKAKIEELRAEIETFRGSRTIADITERAQLQNRLNELQDRVDKDVDVTETLRIRLKLEKQEDIVEQVEAVSIADAKAFGERIDSFLGVGRKDGLSDYRLGIRAAVRGLWSGQSSLFDFAEAMNSTISRRLKQAWLEGASKVGVSEGDLTEDELDKIDDVINQEIEYAFLFGKDIEANNKASGGLLEPLLARAERWLNRYNEMVNLGMLSARDDPKFQWVVTAKESCKSCLKLRDKVKRKSQWDAVGVSPQSKDKLECMIDANGVPVCRCYFEVTNEPLSIGSLPSLP